MKQDNKLDQYKGIGRDIPARSGFTRRIKALVENACRRKKQIDDKFDKSMAALDEWTKMQMAELDVLEERVRNRYDALEVDLTPSKHEDVSVQIEDREKNEAVESLLAEARALLARKV